MTSGLFYLLASVTCSVTVAVLLKLARRKGIDIRQAIAANYAVAAALCVFTLRPSLSQTLANTGTWPVLLALAVLLPTVFMAMAQSVRFAGIVRSDAAQRLSLFIPLLAAFALFGETLTTRKLIAIGLAFVALACVLRRVREEQDEGADTRQAWMWPLAVWLGYGVIDILFKQLSRAGTALPGTLFSVFVLAGLLMLGYLLWRRVQWQPRHLAAGALLGMMNFANILTYIRAHQALPGNPSLVFASMNMGVIALGTLVGALAFRERLSPLNLFGLVLALAAIVAMMP
ncbi:EamA family transporter [Bordetella sp. 2513F-2]